MKLSHNQIQVLKLVCRGFAMQGCNRQCDYGGRVSTLWSLKRKGLIVLSSARDQGWDITRAGLTLLNKILDDEQLVRKSRCQQKG